MAAWRENCRLWQRNFANRLEQNENYPEITVCTRLIKENIFLPITRCNKTFFDGCKLKSIKPVHFSQSVQVSLIVLLWGESYENVSSIRYVEKIYMRCRKTEQVLCRYLKPLGKNINLMIWCLCNHQSDLNCDKMVVLLRDSIM